MEILAKFICPSCQDPSHKPLVSWAYLHNYLGISEIAGTEFQTIARGQAESLDWDTPPKE